MALYSEHELTHGHTARRIHPERCQPLPGKQITYVVPDTEPVFTIDRLALFLRENPEFAAPGQFSFYEIDRLDLGNGFVMITAQTFRFAEDAA